MNLELLPVHESHTAHAAVKIVDHTVLDTTESKYVRGKGYETIPVQFLARRVGLRWVWIDGIGWSCMSVQVSGYRLKKDGNPGERRCSLEYVPSRSLGGTFIEGTPAELVKLEADLRPTTKIVQA